VCPKKEDFVHHCFFMFWTVLGFSRRGAVIRSSFFSWRLFHPFCFETALSILILMVTGAYWNHQRTRRPPPLQPGFGLSGVKNVINQNGIRNIVRFSMCLQAFERKDKQLHQNRFTKRKPVHHRNLTPLGSSCCETLFFVVHFFVFVLIFCVLAV